MVTLSPTNLKTFQTCPRKFEAQYITKELPYVSSPAAQRGEFLHSLMEQACISGWDSVIWPDHEFNTNSTAKNFIAAVNNLKQSGWTISVELEAATDGYGNVTGWWDSQSWIRSKIDVCATHPDKDYAIVIDWKTGKVYDLDQIQLEVNAMCLQPITKLNKYKVMFAYLDQNIIKSSDSIIDIQEPAAFNRVRDKDSQQLHTMLVIENLKEAYSKSFWPETKNRFCNWCGIAKCKYKK